MTVTTCFLTGATGLIGRQVLARLLVSPRVERVHVLTRRPHIDAAGPAHVVRGDVGNAGLGLAADIRAALARDVTTVVHLAANTEFSQSLDEARASNLDGTRRLLELTADWPNVTRWVYVSTAFVAGLRTGVVKENDRVQTRGWANAYEQSKAEAEDLVREARPDWVIARSSTVVCDDLTGAISQVNAVHRALRLYFGGLAPMLPGTDQTRVDVVTTEYVARGIALATLARDAVRRTFHFCAGAGAMPLDELLDVSHQAFLRAPAWRRRGIARPMRTDLETYRLFEAAVQDAGSSRVRQALRSLGHFAPQLAYPKCFDTHAADALLGEGAAPVSTFWQRMVNQLVGNAPAMEAA